MPESILSPQLAVRNAWARTLSLSSNEALQTNKEADNAKNQMNAILANAQSKKEVRYVNEVYAAIESTFRNLATARNHFKLNCKELDELRQTRIEHIENITTLSSNIGSIIPRLATASLGSATGATVGYEILFNTMQKFFPESESLIMGTLVLLFLLGLGSAIGYLVYIWGIAPHNARKATRQLIKKDYDRIMYYRFYLDRVKKALNNLYNTADTLYKDIFGSAFYKKAKSAEKVVDNILESMDMKELTCDKLSSHIANEKLEIDEDIWVKCETKIDLDKCKHIDEE